MDPQVAALEYTKTMLVSFLRAFLKNPDNYSSLVNEDYSNVAVWVENPAELRSWPMILISTSSPGQVVTSGLSDINETLYDENNTATGYRFSGYYQFNVQVDIAAKTSLARDHLADLIAMAYRHMIRRYLEAKGVLVFNLSYGSQSEAPYNTDLMYFSTLNLSTFSEWHQDVPFLDLTSVNIEETQ